jgi:lysophospholipase L1-like esterase
MATLRSRWRFLLATSALTLLLIVVVGPHYGDVQTAGDADAFRALLADGHGRYVAAAIVDLVFALAYGLAALAFSAPLWLSRAGGVLVALGALTDELENITLLRNISRRASVEDGAIETMRRFGTIKYGLILVGLTLLFAGLLWTRRQALGNWLRQSWRAHALYLVVLLATVPVATARLPWGFLLLLFLLLTVTGRRLNDIVRRGRAAPGPDHGPARLLLAACKVVLGAVLAAVGYGGEGRVADIAFFLGLAFVVMGLGAVVSELRQNRRFPAIRGVVLLLAGFAVLAVATMTEPGAALPLVVAGIVVGAIGTELLSADYLRWESPIPGWTLGAVGGLVLVAGIGLLVAAGADPGHALAVVAVLAVVVFFASADGDALVILFLVATALVWASSPVGEQLDEDRTPVAGEPYFVVFGDSYISGEGAETFVEGTNEKLHDADPNGAHTNECRRATTAWPFVVAERAAAESSSLPGRVLFLACSGAITENIHTEPRRDSTGRQHGPAELELFRREQARLGLGPPAFALLSIGGNDAGFAELGKTCLAPGNCAEVGDQFLRSDDRRAPDQPVVGPPGMGEPEALQWIGDDLDAAYTRVKQVVGEEVPVVAVPYPIPLTESGRCRGVLLDEDERRFIRGFVPELNAFIRDRAARNGLHYLEATEDALRRTGTQLCSKVAGKASLNFLALNPTSGSLVDSLSPQNWIHNSLHPNAAGHRALADRAYDWLSQHLPATGAPPPPGPPHRIPSIDEVLAGAVVPQCIVADRPSCRVKGGTWLGEQLHTFFARSLFPLAFVMFGLWLCINPLIRWGAGHDPTITLGWLLWPGLWFGLRRVWAGVRWLWSGG